MKDIDAQLKEIRRSVQHGEASFPLLLPMLDSPLGTIRLAAIRALQNIDGIGKAKERLLKLLETEDDQDVLIWIFSALSGAFSGSEDLALADRMKYAVAKLTTCYDGTKQAYEDALLRIFEGKSTRDILKMDKNERNRSLARIGLAGR